VGFYCDSFVFNNIVGDYKIYSIPKITKLVKKTIKSYLNSEFLNFFYVENKINEELINLFKKHKILLKIKIKFIDDFITSTIKDNIILREVHFKAEIINLDKNDKEAKIIERNTYNKNIIISSEKIKNCKIFNKTFLLKTSSFDYCNCLSCRQPYSNISLSDFPNGIYDCYNIDRQDICKLYIFTNHKYTLFNKTKQGFIIPKNWKINKDLEKEYVLELINLFKINKE
jgi:hypothetical protein